MELSPLQPPLPPPVDVRLTVLPEHPCPYLPQQRAQERALWAGGVLGEELYHDFMDAGFRRSGRMLYQPICPACSACRPLRVVVEQFTPSKSQRRCRRRNSDLQISHGPPTPTDEKFDLYRAYVTQWHGRNASGEGEADREGFELFLYDSPLTSTTEFAYRDPTGRLLAVGLCDVSRRSLSSVYFFFDPAAAERGLGTFGALVELEWARWRGIAFYYLGYWISDCRAMRYKANYRPHQLLGADGQWHAEEQNCVVSAADENPLGGAPASG